MVRTACVLLLLMGGCSSGFTVPAPPDARLTLDLAVVVANPAVDAGCFNTACGGCSSWANPDGTPAKVGDPCLWKGVWQCTGTTLTCSDASCPSCAQPMTGTVCGADGHTIVELTYPGGQCSAYNFGSALDVCNHDATDHCVGKCTSVNGAYSCSARCVSDADGGVTGCQHAPTDTCTSLAGC
jgi:hypothetical protein